MRNIKFLILFLILLLSGNLLADYKRIVSLAPSVTESLYELGMDKELIANTTYCRDIDDKQKKEKIGTVTDPNIEKIISLKPDLIISTKEGNNKNSIEKLIRLKLPVYVMGTVESFDDICNNFLNLAEFVGKKEFGTKIVNDIKNEVNEISKNKKINEEVKVFWEVGANPIFTVGKKSYVNDFNKFIGGKNVFEYIDMRYPNVNIESILEKNPEVIILVDMGDVGKEEVKRWKKYKSLSAVKNNKIFMLDAKEIFTPTPRTFLNGIKNLRSKIGL